MYYVVHDCGTSAVRSRYWQLHFYSYSIIPGMHYQLQGLASASFLLNVVMLRLILHQDIAVPRAHVMM